MISNRASRSTRRTFVAAGAAAIAGGAAHEALAFNGGPKSVTVPEARHAAITRWPRYGPAEKQALQELIDSGRFYQELPRFEKAWQEYMGAPFVKAHMNGTSALISMYFAIDLPPGSELLAPSYTFFATTLPLRFFGYVPVFVDVDPNTCCMDPADAARKITPRTKAIVPMHAWGLPCEMDHICALAEKHGLLVLEDAAQAHGASMQGKKMGNWGQASIFSFQTSKILPTVEGGVGVYKTRQLYERAAAFGHYEDPVKFPVDSPVRAYEGTGFGMKLRMHPFAAAIARKQLESMDERNALVERQVRALNDRLVHLPGLSEPRVRKDQKRGYYHANMLFLDEKKAGFSRDALVAALKAEGVRASTWIYPEQHRFKIYSEPKWWHHPPVIPASMPGSEEVNRKHLFIALMYSAEPELVEQYGKAFEKVWANRARLA